MKDLDVTPATLAERFGWSLKKAQRFMRAVERAHPGVVRRDGEPPRRFVASARAIAPYLPETREDNLRRELRLARDRIAEVERRQDAGRRDLAALERRLAAVEPKRAHG